MNTNSSSSRSVGSNSEKYVKCEHGFEAKFQRVKKGFRAGENFIRVQNEAEVDGNINEGQRNFFIGKIKGF